MSKRGTQTRVGRMRESFWYVPGIIGVAALILAQLMVMADELTDRASWGILETVLFHVGPAGGRDILTAISGSVLTVAATSFSITISVLATASSTYGPRLVRNFMTDRANQYVLGVFCATFLYCITVLRTIRAPEDGVDAFVPDVAINLAVLLAVLNVAVLVFFINHIADSIQVSTLAARVRRELLDSVDACFPAKEDGADAPAQERNVGVGVASPPAVHPHRIHNDRNSVYIQAIDSNRLLEAATKADAVVRIPGAPGTHLVKGELIAEVWPPSAAEDLEDAVRASVQCGEARTPHGDPRFAVQQVVELAVRALSPSTNDPYTALNALDEVTAGLALACSRPDPATELRDDDDALRILLSVPTARDLLDDTFDSVRNYALDHPSVLIKTFQLAERLRSVSSSETTARSLRHHVQLILQAYRDTNPQQHDLAVVSQAAASVLVHT